MKRIEELESFVRQQSNFGPEGEPSSAGSGAAAKEKQWKAKLDEEVKKREEQERWADELVKELEKEKKMRGKLEDERRALAAFVSKFDSLGLGLLNTPSSSLPVSKIKPPGATSIFAEKQQNKQHKPFPGPPRSSTTGVSLKQVDEATDSPVRLSDYPPQPSLLDQVMPEEQWGEEDYDHFGADGEGNDQPDVKSGGSVGKVKSVEFVAGGTPQKKPREVLSDKENIVPPSTT